MIFEDVNELKCRLEINSAVSVLDNDELKSLFEHSDEDWSTEPELLDVLYSYILTKRPHTLVEIGTYKGTAAIVFSEACRVNNFGKVYTIDDGSSIGNDSARDLFQSWSNSRICFIEKTSMDAFEQWGRAEIDFLYIDGDHSYAAACIDFALWGRLMAPGGLIVMHDTRTRLTRHFPDDYIFPLSCYEVLNVNNLCCRPSGHEWEGVAFIWKK